MLLKDTVEIGKRIYEIRKSRGLTQAEVAELAGLSDRAYAEIERGVTNPRILSLLNVCEALRLTPDDIFVVPDEAKSTEEIMDMINTCNEKQKKYLAQIISSFVNSQS